MLLSYASVTRVRCGCARNKTSLAFCLFFSLRLRWDGREDRRALWHCSAISLAGDSQLLRCKWKLLRAFAARAAWAIAPGLMLLIFLDFSGYHLKEERHIK